MGTIAQFPGSRTAFIRTAARNPDPGRFVDEADIDTIEMELRPDDLARLNALYERHSSPEPEPPKPIVSVLPPPAAVAEPARPEVKWPIEPARPAVASPQTAAIDATVSLPALSAPSVGVADELSDSLTGTYTLKLPILVMPAPATAAPNPVVPVAVTTPSASTETQISQSPPTFVKAPLTVGLYEPKAAAASRAAVRRSAVDAVAESARRLPWPLMLLAAVLAIAMLAGLSANNLPLTSDPLPPPAPVAAPAVTRSTVTPAETAPAPEAVAPPPEIVTYRNPFDRSEVFEFPPGTSTDDARDAVAQILMERALERRTR